MEELVSADTAWGLEIWKASPVAPARVAVGAAVVLVSVSGPHDLALTGARV